MRKSRIVLVLILVLLVSPEIFGQAVPPPIPPPPPPGLSLGIGEYFFLVIGLVFGVREIKKVEDF